MLGFAVKRIEMIIPQQKDRPIRLEGWERCKKVLNAKEAPSLSGDHLQPFDVPPPQLIAVAIRWGQAPCPSAGSG